MINSKHIIFYFLIITLLTNCAGETTSPGGSNSPGGVDLTGITIENFLVKDRGGSDTAFTAIGRESNLKFTINNSRTNINELRVQFFSSTEDSSITINDNALSTALVLTDVAAQDNMEFSTNISTNINLNLSQGQYYLGACIVVDEESTCSSGVLSDVDQPGARYPAQDFNTLTNAGNDNPTGIWSDGQTMWVSDFTARRIYAYNLRTKAREPSKDFASLAAANTRPFAISSNGEVMYVSQFLGTDVYAYDMVGKTNVSAKNFNLDTDNARSEGFWFSDNVMLTTDENFSIIFAYRLDPNNPNNYGTRIGPSGEYNLATIIAPNVAVEGLWGSGNILWLSDASNRSILAIDTNSRVHDTTKEFRTLSAAGNRDPFDIWSDGSTMWVVDNVVDKIYAYKMNF